MLFDVHELHEVGDGHVGQEVWYGLEVIVGSGSGASPLHHDKPMLSGLGPYIQAPSLQPFVQEISPH